ncbi:MAG TPA: MipA/OmpV family protein [Hyphomicrobiales bacterium]|nr:MipA/OmpV family protein [Hyphomicrobiales bacterium]
MSHFSGNAKRGALLIATIAATTMAVSVNASGADTYEGGYKDDGGYASSDWSIEAVKVGGFIGVKPTYEGSDEYEAFGFPYIFPIFAGGPGFFDRIDARGLDDVRLRLIERDGFIAGPLAGYDLGREESDGDLLAGLGDVDGGFIGGGFVGYQLGAFLFDVSYHQYFGDADGYQIRFGAETTRYVSDRTKLTTRVGASYADEGYMDTYFSVSGAGPAGAFDADAGFKDVYAQIGIETELDDRWSLRGTARYSRLIGDAADSTIVESEDQFYGLLGLSYKFYTAE